ncbi:piriformospora indica-insensitive protein 2 isoform X1 [Solanum dulcamara]|uniref:piriformospora indica-insensitive protein 2 isoform X1 n=1 Tax=Solanum dulcamara TaxID=45834 RepID=UPI002485FC8A|nr:piriformospora indica-insensitive protein 2 isoform X1 [Solanum dulcamara]
MLLIFSFLNTLPYHYCFIANFSNFTISKAKITTMAFLSKLSVLVLNLCFWANFIVFVVSQPSALNMVEQEAVYNVLESINSDVSWRSLFPDDLCSSSPHGVLCDYSISTTTSFTAHVTEISLGYVSDYAPNPPCTPKSTLNASLFAPFTYLRKIFVYRCFTENEVSFLDFGSLPSSVEELVFMENPALVGSLSEKVGNLSSLRRLVLSGSAVSGEIPDGFGGLFNLEQLTLSRSKIGGEIPVGLKTLKKLKVLDLSQNELEDSVPEPIGNLTQLLKLDLSYNKLSGKIPQSLKGLKNLEFLDLSYNRFSNSGVPLFLAEMPSLKEVYLSGNFLGGQIPEIWENLEGIVGLGLSRTGLIGNIPVSIGVYLKNICYLGLDNNKLEGTLPEEFGVLEYVNELHLENNNLSGRLPFSPKFVSKIGEKLKLEGNPQLCADEGLRIPNVSVSLRLLKMCNNAVGLKSVPFSGASLVLLHASHIVIFLGILFLLC